MQRIYNLDKWALLEEGKRLSYVNSRPRKVVVEVNAPSEVLLYLVEDGKPRFLALVKGRDTVEFYPDGAFDLTCEGGAVYVYTADGDDVSMEALDERTFTRIVERRPRNLELELMQRAAAENTRRLLEAQRQDMEKYIARLETQRAAAAVPPAPAAAPAQPAVAPAAPVGAPAADSTGAGGAANG